MLPYYLMIHISEYVLSHNIFSGERNNVLFIIYFSISSGVLAFFIQTKLPSFFSFLIS